VIKDFLLRWVEVFRVVWTACCRRGDCVEGLSVVVC